MKRPAAQSLGFLDSAHDSVSYDEAFFAGIGQVIRSGYTEEDPGGRWRVHLRLDLESNKCFNRLVKPQPQPKPQPTGSTSTTAEIREFFFW